MVVLWFSQFNQRLIQRCPQMEYNTRRLYSNWFWDRMTNWKDKITRKSDAFKDKKIDDSAAPRTPFKPIAKAPSPTSASPFFNPNPNEHSEIWAQRSRLATIKHTNSRYKPFWVSIPMYRGSPRKLWLVAHAIKGISVADAVMQTRFMAKKAAIRVHDLLAMVAARIKRQEYPHDLFPPHPTLHSAKKAMKEQGMKEDAGKAEQLLEQAQEAREQFVRERKTPEMEQAAQALLRRYTILQVVIGRGPYLKRLDYKAKGKFGIRRVPHAMLRMQVGILDEQRRINKLLASRGKISFRTENKPLYIPRLQY